MLCVCVCVCACVRACVRVCVSSCAVSIYGCLNEKTELCSYLEKATWLFNILKYPGLVYYSIMSVQSRGNSLDENFHTTIGKTG